MNDVELSHSAKSLLRAARADAPSALAKAKIWGSVATSAKVGAGAAAMGGASKLLVLGTIFGSALTVGLAAVLMHVGAGKDPSPPARALAVAPRVVVTEPAAGGREEASRADETPKDVPVAPVAAASPAKAKALPPGAMKSPLPEPTRAASAPAAAAGAAAIAEEDPLMREASLVAEARGALIRGDAAGALRAVQAAKALPARQLQPEELALEAHALQALGRAGEAQSVGGALKTSYPESNLSR